MVSYYTKGRFCNNGFIAIAAYCYAKKHGLEFHVPKESIAPNVWPSNFQHLSNPNWNPNLETVEVNDDGHRYRELPFDESWRDKNIMIGTRSIESGYFQSYRYLEGHEEEIRKVFFNLKHPYQDGCSGDVYDKVAIHWRRGDYLNYPDKHPVVTKEYIFQAIQTIEFLTGKTDWMYHLFSDDPEFIKSFAEKYLQNRYVYIHSEDSVEDDFTHILCCRHQIVSNSSYSVLAAILSPHEDGIVVCPHIDNYFGINNKHLSVVDLYPTDWIQLKY